MNQREYLESVVSEDVVKKSCRCKEIQQGFVKDCVDRYDKSSYFDLTSMVIDTKENVMKYKPLEKEISAKSYAEMLGISIPTARKHSRCRN